MGAAKDFWLVVEGPIENFRTEVARLLSGVFVFCMIPISGRIE